jgi:hypothetical protein
VVPNIVMRCGGATSGTQTVDRVRRPDSRDSCETETLSPLAGLQRTFAGRPALPRVENPGLFSVAPWRGLDSESIRQPSRCGRRERQIPDSAETDLGRISFLWLNGESGAGRERFCARGWRPLERKRIPGGVGILFSHSGNRRRKRSPAASASRAHRSRSGPDTFADRGLSTFPGGWVTIVFSIDDPPNS